MTATTSLSARSDTTTWSRPERALVVESGFPFLAETVHTPRLKLRPLQVTDAPRVAMFAGNFEVSRMTARIPHPYSERDARDFIAAGAVGKALAIVHANGVIGVIGLEAVDKTSADLGYWLGKPFWGRGFMTEAGQAVIAASLRWCPTLTVTASHFEDNPASGHVLAKLGFTQTGERMMRSIARNDDVRALTYRLSRPVALEPPPSSLPRP